MIEALKKQHKKFIFINTAAFILALILHVSKPLILQGQFTEYIKAVLFAATFLSVPGIFAWYTGIKNKGIEQTTISAKYLLIKVLLAVALINCIFMALIPEKSVLFSSLIATFAHIITKYE